jgi:hypothetical protein
MFPFENSYDICKGTTMAFTVHCFINTILEMDVSCSEEGI